MRRKVRCRYLLVLEVEKMLDLVISTRSIENMRMSRRFWIRRVMGIREVSCRQRGRLRKSIKDRSSRLVSHLVSINKYQNKKISNNSRRNRRKSSNRQNSTICKFTVFHKDQNRTALHSTPNNNWPKVYSKSTIYGRIWSKAHRITFMLYLPQS